MAELTKDPDRDGIWRINPFDRSITYKGDRQKLHRVWHEMKADGVSFDVRCELVHKVAKRIIQDYRDDGHLKDAVVSYIGDKTKPDWVEFEQICAYYGMENVGIGINLRDHDATLIVWYEESPRMINYPETLRIALRRRQELIDEGVWDEEPPPPEDPDGRWREEEGEEAASRDGQDVALHASQQGLWD